ncbi:type II secretion system F family protein [Microbacterium sp.]|uniref:type II secretion system F family protein n=1 Tax=Microbacterium sp. TaxID=51671 RepID=UPI003F726718
MHRDAAPELAVVAETLLQLAVLLQAGLAPARAWTHLADTGDPVAQSVRSGLDEGIPLSDAIGRASPPPGPWHEVAAAWRVATTVGAPLADALRSLAEALRDAQRTRDDVRIALAEPAGTARLLAWLPLVAVGLGALLGFDTLAVLVASPMGIACLVAGAVLILAARRWTGALVQRARAQDAVPGLDADVLAIALSGGASIDRARTLVTAATGAPVDPSTDSVLALSRSAGVPAVELLRAAASLARHRARVDGRLRAARLSSRLLLPLGVCTLPAFLLLGVAPMLLSVVSTVPLSL